MSLSEQNRALIEREWGDKIFREGFQQKGARVYPETLDRLLDAARAEGVAALQQAAGDECDDFFTRQVEEAMADPEWVAKWSLPQQTALVEQGVEKIIGPHEPAACGASAPAEALQLPGEDAIAEIIARYVGQHPFEEMAEDRRDLRDKVRTHDGYDINEPTRSDCRDAAAVILGKVFPR